MKLKEDVSKCIDIIQNDIKNGIKEEDSEIDIDQCMKLISIINKTNRQLDLYTEILPELIVLYIALKEL